MLILPSLSPENPFHNLLQLFLALVWRRLRYILADHTRHIDPEARYAPVCPETERLEEIGPDLGIGPVQVGLLPRKDVHVELAVVLTGGFPDGAAEFGLPVVGGLGLVWAETCAKCQ